MTSQQRRRLRELHSKSYTSLSKAEKAELKKLSRLAINATLAATEEDDDDPSSEDDKEEDDPSSEDDEDDDPNAEGEEEDDDDDPNAEGEEDDDDDDPNAEGEEDEEEEEKPKAGKKASNTLGQSIMRALSGIRNKQALGSDLAKVQSNNRALTAERDAALDTARKARLATKKAKAEAATLRGHCAAFAKFFGISAAELGNKTPKEITALASTKISQGVTTTLTELGVSAEQLPSAASNDAGETLEELQAQMATEKDPKKLGVLAVKANKLRDQIAAAEHGQN